MKKGMMIAALVMGVFLNVMGQSTKTLTRSFAANEIEKVTLALEGDVHVKYWDKDFIRVLTTVELNNFNETMLKRLVSAGRYNLEGSPAGIELVITAPKVHIQVAISGQQLEESIKYKILLPSNMEVNILDLSQSTLETGSTMH